MCYDLMVFFFIASNADTFYTSGQGLINHIANESGLFFPRGQPRFYWRPTLLTRRPTKFDWSLAPFHQEFNQFFFH
jgi:hypothetical protein